jgi:hypoxanthine phosphoribosyltransferase
MSARGVTHPEIGEVIITEQELQARVRTLAKEVADQYRDALSKGQELVLVCILKGSFLFTSDLCRALSDERVRNKRGGY